NRTCLQRLCRHIETPARPSVPLLERTECDMQLTENSDLECLRTSHPFATIGQVHRSHKSSRIVGPMLRRTAGAIPYSALVDLARLSDARLGTVFPTFWPQASWQGDTA